MRLERDVEVEIPVAPSAMTLATPGGQAQALSIDGARRNACLDLVRHTAHAAVVAVLGHRELQFERRTAKGIFDADLHRHLEVLPGHARVRATEGTSASAAPTEPLEQVREIHVFVRELAVAAGMLAGPIRRWPEFLTLRARAELV